MAITSKLKIYKIKSKTKNKTNKLRKSKKSRKSRKSGKSKRNYKKNKKHSQSIRKQFGGTFEDTFDDIEQKLLKYVNSTIQLYDKKTHNPVKPNNPNPKNHYCVMSVYDFILIALFISIFFTNVDKDVLSDILANGLFNFVDEDKYNKVLIEYINKLDSLSEKDKIYYTNFIDNKDYDFDTEQIQKNHEFLNSVDISESNCELEDKTTKINNLREVLYNIFGKDIFNSVQLILDYNGTFKECLIATKVNVQILLGDINFNDFIKALFDTKYANRYPLFNEYYGYVYQKKIDLINVFTTKHKTNQSSAAPNSPVANAATTNLPHAAPNLPVANAATTNSPSAATNSPSAATNQPPAATNQPPAATNQPPAATNSQSAAINPPPAAINSQSATPNPQSAANSSQPAANSSQQNDRYYNNGSGELSTPE
jgi:hypothetical protein